MLSFSRRILKIFHPQGIPWPFSLLYDRLSRSGIFQRHYELVAKDITAFRGKGRILDVGTGPGWLLAKIRAAAPEMELTGVDISPAMVSRAKENMARAGRSDAAQISLGSASSLPFDDGSFDIVVSTGSAHHWKNPVEGFNEIYRVLKAGGSAFIYDIASDTPKDIIDKRAREFGRLRMIMMWVHSLEEPFYSCESLREMASASLFGKGEIRFAGVLCCLTMRKG